MKEMRCDGQFKLIFKKVEDELGIKMNCANAQDHVTAAECKIINIQKVRLKFRPDTWYRSGIVVHENSCESKKII